ncbi:MAG: hypothetical protein AAF790_03450 [Planctomycetota bacterium]
MTQQTAWAIAASLVCVAGCQSQLGSVYGVASGKTTAADVLPSQEHLARREAGRSAASAPPVSRASFAPPPLDGPAEERFDRGGPSGGPAAPIARRGPLPEPTFDEAWAAVMPELTRLRDENPAAHAALLSQLQAAEPGHFELIARRFRSDMAYAAQLRESAPQTMLASAAAGSGTRSPSSYPASYPAAYPAGNPPQASPPLAQPTGGRATPAWGEAPGAGVRPTTSVPPARQQGSLRSAGLPAAAQAAATADLGARPAMHFAAPPIGDNAPRQDNAAKMAAFVRAADTTAVTTASAAMPTSGPPPATPAGEHPSEELDWRGYLKKSIAALRASAPAEPHTVDEAYLHARLRMLTLVDGRLDDAVAPIPGLSVSEQDFWSKQLFGLATMLDAESQPELNRRAAAAALHVGMATDKLQQVSSLAVRNLTFCDEVYAFGSYKPRGSRKFTPGEQVTVYVEVQNFRSEETKDGFQTVIGTSFEVLDASGNRVDSGEFAAVEDECLSRRHDFHIQYGIALPERVYPGEYQLELTLTDQLGNKIGRAAIDFEIVESGR